MPLGSSKLPVIAICWTALVLAVAYAAYRAVDPLPPRRFAIAGGIAGTGYDLLARQYARILARNGVELEVRNYSGSMEHFDALRDGASGVQAAIASMGFTAPHHAELLYSLGGISDSPIFIFYRSADPITRFAQFRGRRLSIGKPQTALRFVMLKVLRATDALDASTRLVDLDYSEAIDALIAGRIDAAMFPIELDDVVLQRALGAPGVRLMNVAQAEAISKTVPGLKHVVLWRGLISLSRDVPGSDVDLLAVRNRILVRQDLHPALQYLLLDAMHEVHRTPGPFNRLGEFPAEQPGDLPLSPTARAYYRSGSTPWHRYTSFWLASLLNRTAFFVIPIVVMLVPLIGFAPRFYRWLHVRPVDRLHRSLGDLERELAEDADVSRSVGSVEFQARIAEIEAAVRSLKVPRAFEADLHRLRVHLRMVREDLDRGGLSA